MAAGVARAHPWRQRIFLVAFGREHGVVDVVIAIRPERIVVCVRPQRVVEEIAVGIGPEQRAGPADVAVAESAALEWVERCGGAQVGMREGAGRCRIAASCFAAPRGLSEPPSRRRASETLAMRYCGRAAQRSVSSAIRSGTRFMPRECAHAAGVDAAMRNRNVTGARGRARSSEVHTRAATRMSAAEVWRRRKMRSAAAGMSATKMRSATATRPSTATSGMSAAGMSAGTATVIGNCGHRNRGKHYSHRACCDCGFPHGLAPFDSPASASACRLRYGWGIFKPMAARM